MGNLHLLAFSSLVEKNEMARVHGLDPNWGFLASFSAGFWAVSAMRHLVTVAPQVASALATGNAGRTSRPHAGPRQSLSLPFAIALHTAVHVAPKVTENSLLHCPFSAARSDEYGSQR
jgi:hypothetical protein